MQLPDTLSALLLAGGLRVGAALLALLVGAVLARYGRGAVRRAMDRLTLSPSIEALAVSLVFYGAWVLAIIVALALLGIPVTTIVAALSAIIVVIGLALQQTLQDLAATVIFLLFRPFEIGDTIQTGATTGTVREIQLFATTLEQGDRRIATLSNSEIRRAGIINFTRAGILRADVVLRLAFDGDVAEARAIIEKAIADDPRILDDPKPEIVVDDLLDTGVVLSVRPFVKAGDYWQVRTDLRERIKARMDAADIALAVPQVRVANPPSA